MITIRVYRERGDSAVPGKKVTVSTATGTKSEWTDATGSANFEFPGGKDYKVYVDGKRVHDGSIVGVQIVYI